MKSSKISQGAQSAAQVCILVAFFLVMAVAVVVGLFRALRGDPLARKLTDGVFSFVNEDLQNLERAKIARETAAVNLEIAKIRAKQQSIPFWQAVPRKSIIWGGGALLVCLVIGTSCVSLAHLRVKSIVEQRVGGSVIKMAYAILKRPEYMAYVAQINSIEAIRAQNPERYVDAVLSLSKGLAARPVKGAVVSSGAEPPALPAASLSSVTVPTFAALLNSGELVNGTDILMGFDGQGHAQRRALKDIRAMSIAGQQGAGKTASMAFLIASITMMNDEAETFVIDPHSNHDEGLGAYIRPLLQTGRVHLVNPVDLADTLDMLDQRIDARLNGQESSHAPVCFVVDELAKMGRLPIFTDKLLPVLEKFTEETRKVNFVGVFGSQKWNARHFGGKADIRALMPSLLVHRIKPSQADLLLEDKQESRMVKQLSKAGQALLATAHDSDPSLVTVPLITRQDVTAVANMLKTNTITVTQTMTPERLQKKILAGKVSQAELARKAGVSPALVSRLKTGSRHVTPETARKLATAMNA